MAGRTKENHQLQTQDLADILSSTLALLIEHGHVVKTKDVPETQGLMIYIGNIRQIDGQLTGPEAVHVS